MGRSFSLKDCYGRKCCWDHAKRIFFFELGICQSLDSDQGTHFTGKGLKTCMKILRVNQKFHVPYRPQSSGMVKSQNKSIKMALRTKLSEYDGGWIKYLPSILMAMRATLNHTTGLSPFEICMGRPIRCYEQVRQAHWKILCKNIWNCWQIHWKLLISLLSALRMWNILPMQPLN